MSESGGRRRQGVLSHTLSELLDVIRPCAADDWRVPAGTLQWSVVDTVDHLVDVCTWFAVQFASAATAHTAVDAKPPPAASNAERVCAIAGAAALLDTVISAARPGQRAWHPAGSTDARTLRAMALAEITVHGHDITAGLGLNWQPEDSIVRQVLSQLFPGMTVDADPWQLLLWAHNRVTLDGRAQPAAWSWRLE